MKTSQNTFNQKSTQDLLFFFKHDGSIDFNKKLIAGKELFNRKYDRHKLSEEKNKIIQGIKSELKQYGNPEHIKNQHKKDLYKNLAWAFALNILIISVKIFSSEEINKALGYELLTITSGIILLPIIHFLWRTRILKKKLDEGIRNKAVLEDRLNTMEKEWPF